MSRTPDGRRAARIGPALRAWFPTGRSGGSALPPVTGQGAATLPVVTSTGHDDEEDGLAEETPRSRAQAWVASAGALARWAGRAYIDLARMLPGAAAVEAELHALERSVLMELRRRLDAADPIAAGRPALDHLPAPLPDVPAPATPA